MEKPPKHGTLIPFPTIVNVPVQEIRHRFGASVRPDYTTNVRQQEVIQKVVEYFGLEYVKEHIGQLTRLHAVIGTANTFHQFGKLKINFIHTDRLVTRETNIPPLQIQTQLRSYLDGYDAYFMKCGNEYTVRNSAAKSQLQDAEQAWHNFITGPWRHFPGFRWYALPLPPPPLPLVRLLLFLLTRLLLLACRLLHLLLLPLVLLHLLVPVYPDFAYPPLPPLVVSHLSQTFPPPLPLLLARRLLLTRPLLLALMDLLPLVLLHLPMYPDFTHPPLPPLAVSHLFQTFPPLLPAPQRVPWLQT
ncbi:hypothetical protein B0H14DRAFT_3521961 [Mycena olivaceomarginata]|nr:hypothetical protein B0H14DRAFT_3521961 [Mycena olivaceomarginata]